MRAFDMFCGGGGASMGLHRAGFDMMGIDLLPHKRYPFTRMTGDALALSPEFLSEFDLIWASPPCQLYTRAGTIHGRHGFVDLIPATRDLLIKSGRPYIIENVIGAPLRRPVMLCGAQFDLKTYRHRLFESNVPLTEPPKCVHIAPNAPMGRPPLEHEFMWVVGQFGAKLAAQEAMGIDWMTNEEMAQAVPPAYSEYLGNQVISWLRRTQDEKKRGSCGTYGPVLSAVEGM